MPGAATQLIAVGGADIPSAPAAGDPVSARRPVITIRGLSKSFNDTVIYDKFDLDLPQGEFISIFGPNGCGKSTLINMISGLMPVDAGQVLFDGQTIQETRLSYVFQNYRDALFPWLRAIDNIHYPLKLMGLSRRERNQRVEQLLADFGVKIDLNSYPYMLSGGQQQTVSILRALVTNPEDDDAPGLARSRGGGATRQPRPAADPAADAGGRLRRHRPALAAQHRERDRPALCRAQEPLPGGLPTPDRELIAN